jgi:hypothetical protein
MLPGIEAAFAAAPERQLAGVNISLPQWATKIQSTVQSAVIDDPTINYILPIYDGMNQFVVPQLPGLVAVIDRRPTVTRYEKRLTSRVGRSKVHRVRIAFPLAPAR